MSMINKRKNDRINLVLNVIKENPNSSKSEIKKLSGLSMEVVLQYIDHLTKEGLICAEEESETKETRVGRKAECYKINPKGCYFLGVKFTARRISGVIVDFSGKVLVTYESEYEHKDVTEEELMNRLYCCVENLTKTFPCSALTAIGIAAPGLVNSRSGVLVKYNRLKCAKPVPIKECFEQRFGVLTFVDSTVKTKAISYQLSRDDFMDNLAYVFIGTGCSLAYIYKDKLYRGYDNFDGELGHLYVPGSSKKCSCGKVGCLETVIGTRYILEEVRRRMGITLDMDGFCQKAEEGDSVAIDILDNVAKWTAYALSSVITLYAPQTIVLCGDYVTLEEYVKRLEKYLPNYCLKELCERVKIIYIKNQKQDNAFDASQLCYYRMFYNKKLT